MGIERAPHLKCVGATPYILSSRPLKNGIKKRLTDRFMIVFSFFSGGSLEKGIQSALTQKLQLTTENAEKLIDIKRKNIFSLCTL